MVKREPFLEDEIRRAYKKLTKTGKYRAALKGLRIVAADHRITEHAINDIEVPNYICIRWAVNYLNTTRLKRLKKKP